MERLREHDIVTLTVGEGRSVRASCEAVVLAFSDRGVSLDRLNMSQVLRLPDVISDSLLVFQHGSVLVGLRGTLMLAKPFGHLRFIVAESNTRRKEGTRMEFEMPIDLSHASTDQVIEGTTVAIGADGLTVTATLDVPVGDLLTISFMSSGPDRIDGTAEVVSNIDGLLKLKLDVGSVDARANLRDIVVTQSRAGLNRKKSAKSAHALSY